MLLDIKNLSVSLALDSKNSLNIINNISMSLKERETLCLVGESGSGKSITALSILRLIEYPLKIFNGEIIFKNRDLLKLKNRDIQKIRWNEISMIFQDPMNSLNPSFTIYNQLKEVLMLHSKLKGAKMQEKIVNTLKLVEFPTTKNRLNEYSFRLSGGLRQRVMIAMALLGDPKIIIADEPTTALDVTIQAQILNILDDIKKESELSMIFITHDLGVVSQIADTVAIMYLGSIVEKSNVKNIFSNPKHPYTEGLLESIPSIKKENKSKKLYSIKGNVPTIYKIPKGCLFWTRCPYVKDICKHEIPKLIDVGKEHLSACFKSEGII